jgi:hypothetical protein
MPRSKPTYHYVNDHGEIYRMTLMRYSRYLLAGTKETWPNASDYGTFVCTVTTVNAFTPDDFNDAFNSLHKKEIAERERLILSVKCPICEALPKHGCQSTSEKRADRACRARTPLGCDVSIKRPHSARERLAMTPPDKT